MQILAIAFFSLAALLSAVLMPNNMTLLPLLLLSAARAVALALALLFWVASGRVDRWGSSRAVLALLMILGAAAVAGGCLAVQMVRDDNVPAPVPLIYRVNAGVLPICFMAREMAASIRQGKPPTRFEVRNLSSSVGSFWVRLGSSPEGRLADLAAVRDVVRAAGDDTEKAAFAWADGALAPAPRAQSAGHPK